MKWHCPHCRRELEANSLDDLRFTPFCSERCRMADLHGWLSDRYVISHPAEEADIGETGTADLTPPPGNPASSDG